MKTYLINTADLKQSTAISDNVDPKHLTPYFEIAHRMKIKPLLGEALTEKYVNAIEAQQVIDAATQANPVAITTDAAHGLSTGAEVTIYNAEGMTEINGTHTITVTGPTSYTLDGVDGTGYGVYESGSGTSIELDAYHYAAWLLLKDAMAYWTFHESIPFVWVKFKNAGILKRVGGEDHQPASASEVKWFQGKIKNHAEYFTEEARLYLVDNREFIPLYDLVEDGCKNRKFSGWEHRVQF